MKIILISILFLIIYNSICFFIFNYTFIIIKYIIFNFLPIYLFINLFTNKKLLFSFLNSIPIFIINIIKFYDIIDHIDINIESNLEVNGFNISDIFNWCGILKRKFYYMIYKDNIYDNINRNKKLFNKNIKYENKFEDSNISYSEKFLNIYNNIKFYFINILVKDLNNNINSLFNSLNIYFKSIFNDFDNNINDPQLISYNLNKIILNMEELDNNYNNLIIHKNIYINYKNDLNLFSDLYGNINYQKLELDNLNEKINRLFIINSELVLNDELSKQIYNISRLNFLIYNKMEELQSSKFYWYYKIDIEINKTTEKINKINTQEFLCYETDILSELFDLNLYNYILYNEKLYYIIHFELGLDLLKKEKIQSNLQKDIKELYINVLHYDKLLNPSKDPIILSLVDRNIIIFNHIQFNPLYNKTFKGKSYFYDYLESKIIEDKKILYYWGKKDQLRLLKPSYNKIEDDKSYALKVVSKIKKNKDEKY